MVPERFEYTSPVAFTALFLDASGTSPRNLNIFTVIFSHFLKSHRLLCNLTCIISQLGVRTLLREHSLVLELRREALVRNRKLLALLHKLRHLLVKVRTQLRLQAGKLHPQRLFACTDCWVLELTSLC